MDAITKQEVNRMIEEFGSDDFRQCLSTGIRKDRLWLKGAEKLVETAMGLVPGLPYNLNCQGPAYGRDYSRVRSIEDPGGELLSGYARFAGWLGRMAGRQYELRVLDRLMTAGLRKRGETGSRGVGSPYVTFDLWAFAVKYRTPELANRRAAAVIRRADVILRPYGLRASWAQVGKVLTEGSGRTGKAALRLAEATCQGVLERHFGVVPQYNEGGRKGRFSALTVARGGLAAAMRQPAAKKAFLGHLLQTGAAKDVAEAVEALARLENDATDGVIGWLDPTTRQTRHGVETVLVWTEETVGRRHRRQVGKGVWLVSVGGESYHAEYNSYGSYTRQCEWKEDGGRQAATQEAIEAIRRRREATKPWQERFDLERAVPLVWVKDSLRVGNCLPGTMAFAAQHGWASRQFVPVTWLLPYAGNSRVDSVLRQVAERENLTPKTGRGYTSGSRW